MQRNEVASSRIKSIGYDRDKKVLEIEFFTLGIYQYIAVPPQTYDTFMTVKSKGRFFDGVINNKYLCRKVK